MESYLSLDDTELSPPPRGLHTDSTNVFLFLRKLPIWTWGVIKLPYPGLGNRPIWILPE